MKSKQYPSEVYVLRKRVNLSSESSQLISDEAVNQFTWHKKRSQKEEYDEEFVDRLKGAPELYN